MVTRTLGVALVVALGACQGQGSSSGGTPPLQARDAKVATATADAEPEPEQGSAPAPRPEEIEPPDPGKAIADLGAIPAWQAVVDRAQYLARRNQHGVVFGRLGDPILVAGAPAPVATPDAGVGARVPDAGMVASELTWLVDDTEGNGALAIRVKLGAKGAALKAGDRVALGGAWTLDGERRWYWEVDAVTPLPAAPAPSSSEPRDPPSPPGHAVADGKLPAGARMISVAKDNDVVYFMVVGKPPAVDGDGWPVADELGNPVVALLNLPGERASFGGQDYRTSDERWQLRRGQLYWVRIGKIRRPQADKPAVINARTAPVRVN